MGGALERQLSVLHVGSHAAEYAQPEVMGVGNVIEITRDIDFGLYERSTRRLRNSLR
jgi:hypothetical protein